MAALSIIIPVLNEQAGIESFLQALQVLRPECELIVVDGGSSDNTVALSQPYVDDIVCATQGRAVQMNIGAAMASAPALLFLHADTFLPDDVLKQIQTAFNNNYDWGRFDVKFSDKHCLLRLVASFMNIRSRLTGMTTGDQAIFIQKAVFETLNGFSDIPLMEDIELSSRLKQHSKPYCSRSKVQTSARRWLNFGIIKTILLMWWLRLRYFIGTEPQLLAILYREGKFWNR